MQKVVLPAGEDSSQADIIVPILFICVTMTITRSEYTVVKISVSRPHTYVLYAAISGNAAPRSRTCATARFDGRHF